MKVSISHNKKRLIQILKKARLLRQLKQLHYLIHLPLNWFKRVAKIDLKPRLSNLFKLKLTCQLEDFTGCKFYLGQSNFQEIIVKMKKKKHYCPDNESSFKLMCHSTSEGYWNVFKAIWNHDKIWPLFKLKLAYF